MVVNTRSSAIFTTMSLAQRRDGTWFVPCAVTPFILRVAAVQTLLDLRSRGEIDCLAEAAAVKVRCIGLRRETALQFF